MKIVHFDVNEVGERILSKLSVYGEQLFFVESAHEVDRAQWFEAEVVTVNHESDITREAIDGLPNLKLIATRSTGYDHIDYMYAKEKGIPVVTVPEYGSRTVAEYSFALMMSLVRKVPQGREVMRMQSAPNIDGLCGFDLEGKTLGLVGTGRIGQNMGRFCKAFGMHVVAFDAYPNEAFKSECQVEYVGSIEEVAERSDVLSIHVPDLPETHHCINASVLSRVKQGAYVINTARGGVVDTIALRDVLVEGRLGGAGIDVLEYETEYYATMHEEVPSHSDPQIDKTLKAIRELVSMKNVIVTPHQAFYSTEAEERILQTTIENIISWKEGEVRNGISV
ncbi:MAG: NAD(P)-dependent oxidoreductase [Candidatus Paceibacterota bacterium]